MRRIHRWPVNSPHKGSVTRKMFSFDDVIMYFLTILMRLSRFRGLFGLDNFFRHSRGLFYIVTISQVPMKKCECVNHYTHNRTRQSKHLKIHTVRHDDVIKWKRLSKQSPGWWFETPSRLLLRHCCDMGKVACTWVLGKYQTSQMAYSLICVTSFGSPYVLINLIYTVYRRS